MPFLGSFFGGKFITPMEIFQKWCRKMTRKIEILQLVIGKSPDSKGNYPIDWRVQVLKLEGIALEFTLNAACR